ncbi:hypothetical protein BCD64_10210 [Nostoc sp. MBR 210]|nr:hypothetical protein BCD64_10210 [Nostoc sp. MBR 210]
MLIEVALVVVARCHALVAFWQPLDLDFSQERNPGVWEVWEGWEGWEDSEEIFSPPLPTPVTHT